MVQALLHGDTEKKCIAKFLLLILYQRYTKGIQKVGHFFGTTFGTRKLFSEKIHSRGKLSKHYTSRVLYIPLYPTNLQIFGTKPHPRRRFLQHYYRDTFIESHRTPTEVLEMLYSGRVIRRELVGRTPTSSSVSKLPPSV